MIIGLIPSRLNSKRLKNKSLLEIDGLPMIVHTFKRAMLAKKLDKVIVCTDNKKTKSVVENHGGNAILTSKKHNNGTERIAEVSKKFNCKLVIDIQGDEPLLDPNDIRKVIDEKLKYMDSVINCMSRLNSTEASNRNIPKVVANFNNGLVYISRSGIPGTKYGHSKKLYKQVCIYAFTKDELDKFYQYGLKNGKSPLEWTEDIEILRFVELGIKVKMIEVYGNTHAVDIPEDVKIVEEILNERGGYD